MPEFVLENEGYKATFSTMGAELVSFIKKNKNVNKNKEYIWQADPKVWARHAPILFPVVGKSKVAAGKQGGCGVDEEQILEGTAKEMAEGTVGSTAHGGAGVQVMGQHGFARDMEFRLLFASEDSLMFQLTDNDETKKVYPYQFNLMVSYKLTGNALKVTWQVINPGEEDLPFSIGGHPAFVGKGASLKNGALQFNFDEAVSDNQPRVLQYGLLEGGLLKDGTMPLELNDRNQLRLSGTFFDQDALIFEGDQCHSITLLEDWQPLVRVDFAAPVFGLWSAAGKDVPFVCIEPWYGRTDRLTYEGNFAAREHGTVLQPNSLFEASYTMTFGK